MADENNEYFLGRGGDIFGPYTKLEIDTLKQSGEFEKYSWFWGPQNESWVAINPPPKPPKMKRGGAASLSESEVRAQNKPGAPKKPKDEDVEIIATRLQAVCHSGDRVISGMVSEATSKGFLLTSKDYPDMIPPFSKGSAVRINLLDDVSGLTENYKGSFSGVGRKGSHWELHFEWEALPKLLSK